MLRTDRADGVLTITLARPERRNAIDGEMAAALREAFETAADDAGVRAVILTGEGRAFSAGGDLSRFERDWDPREFRHDSHRLTQLITLVERLEKPTVAAINGAVTGAGTQLALVCDVRLAAAGARLIYREGRLGIIPSHGGVTRLVKLIGLARAKDVLLGGEGLTAQEAHRAGLVTEVVDDDRVAGQGAGARGGHARALAAGLCGGQAAAVAGGQRRPGERDGRRRARAEPADRHRRAQAGGEGAMIIELDGKTPQVADDAYIAPTAVLIGDVTVEAGASVWFGAVLRGDNSAIVIGAGSNIQDNCVIHCADQLPTVVGENVTVGHMALLEGCQIGDGALVGMGAIVLQRAKVGARALVAAGAVVGEGVEIPDGVLAAGVPAKVKKELAGSSQRWVETAAREYQAKRLRYMR